MPANRDRKIEELFSARRPALLRFLTARLGDPQEAEDVLQESFFRYRNADEKSEILSPEAYLARIAGNLAIDHIRQNNSRQAREKAWGELQGSGDAGWLANGSVGPLQERGLAARQELDRVIGVLDDLSPRVREAFVLHKFKGHTHREVARIMGLSRSTVEKHMIKALKHLLQEFRETGNE